MQVWVSVFLCKAGFVCLEVLTQVRSYAGRLGYRQAWIQVGCKACGALGLYL